MQKTTTSEYDRGFEDLTSSDGIKKYKNGDSLFFPNFDHPEMMLVSSPLTRINYFTWSRSIKITLRAKMKICFIDGRFKKHETDSSDYD